MPSSLSRRPCLPQTLFHTWHMTYRTYRSYLACSSSHALLRLACNCATRQSFTRLKFFSTYPYLVGRRSRVRFPGRLRPRWGRSPARRAGTQCHIVGVFAPFPRVHHEVAEPRAGRRHVLGLPRFDGGGLDDGHQHSLGRVVAKDYTRVLVVSHCTGRITNLRRQAPKRVQL